MSSDAEKENTFRALKDQDLLVTSKWCRFGLHRWTKWKTHSYAPNIDWNEKAKCRTRQYIFERNCADCNVTERKSVELPEGGLKIKE